MKLLTALLVTSAFTLSACSENRQAAAATADERPGAIRMPLPEPASAKLDAARNALIDHMHLHARQLGRLVKALQSGDLEATQTPAYWLSRHEEIREFPEEWRPHLVSMREAAKDVQWSTDIQTARAAAGRIAESCHACHAEAGFEVDVLRTDFD